MKQDGFIALMSAIIISVLLLAIVLSLGFSGFFARFNVLDSESKERSVALAEACGDTAIYNFAQGSTFTGVVTVGSETCNIISVQDNAPVAGKALIKTQKIVNKAATDLKIQIDDTALTIDSWEECPNLTSSSTGC